MVATGTTDPSVIPGITTLTDNSLVVVAVSGEDNNNGSITTTGTNPAAYTEHYAESATGADGVITFSEAARAVAGATGNVSVNWNTAVPVGFGGIVLALRPGTTYYSRVTGNWGTAGTWSRGGCNGGASLVVPPAGADVVICDGHTVTLNTDSAALNSLTVQATGILNVGNTGAARTLTVTGDVNNAGTLQYNNNNGNHVITVGGNFVNSGTFTHIDNASGGNRTLTVAGLITNAGSGILRFAGGGPPGQVMTINANGGIINNGTLDVNSSSNATHSLNVGGDFTNNNTVQFVPDTDSFVHTTFNGSVAQNVTGSVANTIFYNLTVSNANGLNLSGTHSITVTNTLDLAVDGAIITTGSNLVRVGWTTPTATAGAVTGANANRFINGNLQRYIIATATYDFDVGTIAGGNRWTPVQLQLGAFTTAGFLQVSTAPGDHAQIGSSGMDTSKTVNRTWTLVNSGLVFPGDPANRLRFVFVAADIDGGATPANFHIGRYTGSWSLTPPPTPNAQPLFTEISDASITSATVTGDFQVGEKLPVVTPPDSFNAVEVGANAVTGRIFTKLRSANFTLDIVAIQGGVQQNNFSEAVTIDVVTGGSAGANCGGAVVTTIAGPTDVILASGRVTTANINVATAYPNVRVRIRYPVGGPYTIITCSSDNFSIKPTAFTISSTDATNTGTGAGATIKTGATFNLTAAGGAGYTGTPGTNFTGNVTGTPTAGTLGPVGAGFLAADGAGTASGTFYYGEVGNFGLSADAVRDTSFTSVDLAGTDCVASSTSDPVGGPYGCWVGSNAVAQSTGVSGFGRFIPDNFNVTYPTPPIFGTTCGTFTYVGTLFTYPSAVMRVTARAGTANGLGNATTVNYAGSYVKLTTATLNQAPYNTKAARYTRFDALNPSPTPALDHTGLPDTATDPAVGAFTNGVGDLTFSPGTGLMFTRDNAAPNAQFNADIALALNVVDGDSVAFGSNPASFGTATSGGGISFSGGKAMRYGRLRLANANGSQLVPLSMLMETQYWNGSSFITNADDNCTSLVAANVGLGNYAANLQAGETTPTIGAGNFSKGRKMLTFSPPGAANNGSVDVVLNLGTTTTIDSCVTWLPSAPTPSGASLGHLRGRWCGATHTKDPTARARFGVFRGSEEVIHMRENFQ